MATKGDRREYGAGSVYQAHVKGCPKPTNAKGDSTCKCPWRGAAQAGFTATGGRRRVTVTGRTEAEVKRRLRDRIAEIKAGEVVMSPTTTVKAWSDKWLPIKQAELSPNGYKALASPIRTYVIPTIGHKRLAQLSRDDVRAIEAKVRTEGNRGKGAKGTTAAATQRALFNMLRAAIAEGHAVPTRVLMTPMPKTTKSDRKALTIPEALAVLAKAGELPHGTRWAVALLCGMRQGECLGLTWDAVDFNAQKIRLEWQLQRIPYRDKHDRCKGFALPPEFEARQVHKAWHLTRPKSSAGVREYPLLPAVARMLLDWRDRAPDNPLGLVWPTDKGTPRNNGDDLAEWHALQAAANVSHPNGRPYHVHECRNVTATELRNAGTDETILTALMGHTDVRTSRGYITTDMAAKRSALEKVAELLELG